MANIRLSQRRVDSLKARRKVYDVRDDGLKGFGVRVLPSGRKSYFVHVQHDGQRVWKQIGEADVLSEPEARVRATLAIASIRRGDQALAAPADKTLFEAVAEEVFRGYGRHWKPRTLEVNRGYLKKQILPWFKGRQIADITRDDVQRWFRSLGATPVAADRSAPILSVIMRQAEAYGYRPEESNPCTGIKRHRRRGRERFLSGEDLQRLGRVLHRREADRPLQVAAVRLLLLTGCRKGEVLSLKWSFYREGKLFLPDSKTGPRTVWLSSAARTVLEALPRRAIWVFPGERRDGPVSSLDPFWNAVRAEADLRDVRLHDLRHTYASVALMNGETVLTIGKLLGHDDPATTLKYIHLSEAAVRDAVKAVAPALAGEA